MTEKYSITREDAAVQLTISTRTIDRWIRGGKLSYKKVANKVLLNLEEVKLLQNSFSTAQAFAEAPEIISQATQGPVVAAASDALRNTGNTNVFSPEKNADLHKMIDEKIDKFFLVFQEKDRIVEEKNKVIFMLQQRVGELESKIQTMIALPDYTQEKQKTIIEKEKLQEKIKQLSTMVRSEQNKGYVFIILFVLAACAVGFIVMTRGGFL